VHPTELEPDGLYHLATAAEWAEHQRVGSIAPESLATEGFVHCSWGRQVEGTVAKHFEGVTHLLALRLDADQVGADLVEEDSYGSGQAFPHIYRPVPVRVVTSVVEVRRASDS